MDDCLPALGYFADNLRGCTSVMVEGNQLYFFVDSKNAAEAALFFLSFSELLTTRPDIVVPMDRF